MTEDQAKEWIDRWMSAGGSWSDAQSLAQLVNEMKPPGMLGAYASLTDAVLRLSELKREDLADRLRDFMDDVWYALTDEERETLSRHNQDI